MMTNESLVLLGETGQRWGWLLGAKLGRSGVRVCRADSMTKILRFIETSTPDLIVLDQEVVSGSVDSFVRLLRRRAGAARLILVAPPGASGAEHPEAWGVLWKPLDLGLLLSAIESALGEPLDQVPDSGGHILCVDDDPLFLRSLERILKRYDYRVTCFRQPELVPDALPALRPDLAIFDLQMPMVDGRRLAHAVRNIDPDRLPIIVLSGRLSDPNGGWPRGVTHLQKPADPETVLEAVERLLEGAGVGAGAVMVRE